MQPALALRSVLVVAAAENVFNHAFAGRYGWQRDERGTSGFHLAVGTAGAGRAAAWATAAPGASRRLRSAPASTAAPYDGSGLGSLGGVIAHNEVVTTPIPPTAEAAAPSGGI